MNNRVEALKVLAQSGANLNRRVGTTTILHLAANSSAPNALRYLVERGFSPDLRDEQDDVPLHDAAWGHDVAGVKTLLELGADPKATRKEDRRSPLHVAAQRNFVAGIRLLVDAGVDVDVGDVNRVTPLIFAAWGGHVQAVQLLLELGADPNRRAAKGVTALAAAREKNHTAIVDILKEAVR